MGIDYNNDYFKYLDEMPAAYCIIEVLSSENDSLDNYIIKYANNELSHLSGFSKEKICEATFDEIFEGSKERWFEIFKITAFEGIKQTVTRYIPVFKRFITTDIYRLEEGYCGCIIKEAVGFTDDLMNCLNIEGFRLRSEEIITNNPLDDFAFWYCDIKRFTFINMNYGYHEGDYILSTIGKIIDNNLNDNEIMGHISGDVFIIMTKFDGYEKAIERFNKLIYNSEHKMTFEVSHAHKLDFASGVYVSFANRRDIININHFIDFAHTAELVAKKQKGSYVEFFTDKFFEKERRADDIEKHLTEALINNEIDIYLQPQYNYLDGSISGCEILSRWRHPELGNISPDEFIPILEKTGHIFEFDIYIWDKAIKYLKYLNTLGYYIPISINLSRNDIFSNRIVDILNSLTNRYGVDKKLVHLEITETAYIDNPAELIEIVNELSTGGFHIEMDDFGSGFSSLSMFKELSIKTIKLDISFLRNLKNNHKAIGIISSVIRMAHNMDVEVIAEGIENENQAKFLKSVGCIYMQGYYFSKPISKDDYLELLKESKISNTNDVVQSSSLSKKLHEALDDHDHIFNKSKYPSVIVEYLNNSIEIVFGNDAFYDLNKKHISKIYFDYDEDQIINKDEIIRIKDTIEAAISNGFKSYDISFNNDKDSYHLNATLIAKSENNSFILIELIRY